jgi:hypothetical protein
MEFQEKASAAFAKGDLVALTSGQIDICGANPTNILGIADQTKTGTAGTMIPVTVIRPGDLLVAKSDTTTAASQTGNAVSITTTTTAVTVNSGTTGSNQRANVIGLYDAASSGGRVIFTIIPKYLYAGGNNIV